MRRPGPVLAALALVLPLAVGACGSSSGSDAGGGQANTPTTVPDQGTTGSSPSATSSAATPAPSSATGASGPTSPDAVALPATCPVKPVTVTVTVNQWGDIAKSLGGACATTTAIITSASVDPHDYEPTPRDISTFSNAQLVIENGAGYDDWAGKALASAKSPPAVVDAGRVVGVAAGGNPHLFYSPTYVAQTADAITEQLTKLQPAAGPYFAQANAAWKSSRAPFDAELATVRAAAAGKSFESTETVADYLAAAAGLTNVTPERYRNLGEGDEPTPGDISAFQQALRSRTADVLFYNTQTEGAVPQQFRATAQQAGVPVVNVTETVPEQFPTYEAWQLSVLQQIATALHAG